MAPYWIRTTPPSTTRQTVHCVGDLIDATVTNDELATADWVRCLLYSREPIGIVALRAKYERGPVPGRAATLQLCAGNRCLVLQLFHAACVQPPVLDLLEDGDTTFVGFGVEGDASNLEDDYGIWCRNRVELDSACARHVRECCPWAWERHGKQRWEMESYAQEILDVRVAEAVGDDHEREGDWDGERLTEAQDYTIVKCGEQKRELLVWLVLFVGYRLFNILTTPFSIYQDSNFS